MSGLRTAPPLGVTTVRESARRSASRAAAVPGARLLGTAWLPVMFVTNHRVFLGESAKKAGLLNAGLELVAYGVALLALLADRRHSRLGDPAQSAPTRVYLTFFLFPAWATASLVWGDPGAIEFIRCLELGITAVLATATIHRARTTPGFLDEMLAFLLRWFTRVILALTVLGFAVGPKWARVSPGEHRFSWIAAHPAVSGAFLAAVLPILLLAPRNMLRMRLPARVISIGLVVLALLKNHSRTSVVGALLAVVAAVWLIGKSKTALRIFVPPYMLGAATIAILYAYRDVADYALRGQPTAQLLTLNNRTRVWAELPDKLTTFGRWMIGLGYNSSKSVFAEDFAWAGNAHNTVVALMVSLGVIGTAIVLAYVAFAIVGVWRTLLQRDAVLGGLVLAVFLSLMVQGVTGDVFAHPNFGMGWLYLCMAIGVAEWRHRPGAELHDGQTALRTGPKGADLSKT